MTTSPTSDQPTQDKLHQRQIAVALEGRCAPLPTIVASGYGEVAKQILEIAFANGIRVREDADLAAILAALNIGDEVPLEALHAVSELLARVYAANGEPPSPPPTTE